MRILPILLLLISGIVSHAQKQKSLRSITSLDIGFFSAAFTHAPTISQRFTIDLSAGIGPGYDIAEGTHLLKALPAVFVSVTPKFYYNIQKRIDNGKATTFNSGNFLGARLKYSNPVFVDTDEIRPALLANAFWGLQRPLGKSWFFGAQAGVGYSWDVSSEFRFGTLYPAIDFRFGYSLGKKKN